MNVGNKYKLIAIDLDGTLLNEEKLITDKNKEALKKCLDNDIKVVISSGRALENIKMFMDELGIKNGYCSAFHGSTIFRAEDLEIVNETFLEGDISKDVLELVSQYNNVGILAYTRNNLYTINKNEFVQQYCGNKHLDATVLNDFNEIQEKISKILLKGKREDLQAIKEKAKIFDDRCRILFSELDLLEFMSLKTNKGFSLEKICEMFSIDINESIAIGDNYNDVEMIEKAGVGVAVYNAVDLLKEKADYVTKNDNNQDAIYEVVNKYFQFN